MSADCAIAECPNLAHAHGWCSTHYQRAQKYGHPLGKKLRRKGQKCNVRECWRASDTRGWCVMHYGRWRRNGDPMVKRRARGVMDAPVTPLIPRPPKPTPRQLILGPTQRALLCAIALGPVSIADLAERLNITPMTVEVHASRIRCRFGFEAIITHHNKLAGRFASAYQLNPAVLR